MSVSTPAADYEAMRSRWQQMRDCVAGGKAIHEAGPLYLPALAGHMVTGELERDYWNYNARALFYGATGRTIDGLSGMVFRRPPTIELPEKADYLKDDCDLLGRSIADFADAVLREDLTLGRVGVLVDHTRPISENALASAEERRLAAAPDQPRPYVALYAAEQILDVVHETRGGIRRPVQVRLLEQFEVPGEAEFETTPASRVRVLEMVGGIYQQRIFTSRTQPEQVGFGSPPPRVTFEEEETIIPLNAGEALDFIPFWIIDTGAAPIPGEIVPPPLLDLSDVNLVHYRLDADYRNALHVAGVPTPVFTGVKKPEQPLRLGTMEGIFLEDPGSGYGFLSYGAEGVEAIMRALNDLEAQMAFLGARMLQPDKRAAEAAETARIYRQGEFSILARIAHTVSNQLSSAIRFMLEWAGIEATLEHGIVLNDDFSAVQAPANLVAEMVKAWQAGAISHDSLWRFMIEGELVDPRRSVDREIDIMDEEQQAEQERNPLPPPQQQFQITAPETPTLAEKMARAMDAMQQEAA